MKNKLNFWYGSIFGTYWMIYGIVCSFASVFLLAKGYSNSQIGITFAAANIVAVVMQPVTADIADRSSRIGTIGISSIMTVMMMTFTLGLFFFRPGSIFICVAFVLMIGWHTVLQPMYNSLTFKLEETGLPVNFGVARSVGSLAYSLLVAVLGTMVEHMGVMVLPAAAEITSLMMLVSLFFTWKNFDRAMKARGRKGNDIDAGLVEVGAEAGGRAPVTEKVEPNAYKNEDFGIDSSGADDADPDEVIGLVEFIKRNRMFFVLNIAVVGIFFSNATLNNYMAQIVMDVGGTSEDMGRILGVMAFLEIPTMVFFSRLKRRFSCQLLLKVASVGFTIKIFLCWIAGSVVMLFIAQAFQLISFALFLPGMVYLTGENMSRGEAVKGQALFTTMITLTTIFASLLGGWILDVSGAKALALIATLATAAGAVLLFAVVDRIGRK